MSAPRRKLRSNLEPGTALWAGRRAQWRALLDGMVGLASCDKATPGQLMAAGRLNIPTIVVVCGYQRSGEYKGEHVDIEEVFLKSGYVASGRVTVADLTAMADVAVRSPGVCAGMGTANSMHIVCEALG